MSFFNLNFMGYDNHFKSMKRLDQQAKLSEEDRFRKSVQKQLAKEITGNIQSRDWSTPAISNLNYHLLRRMHVRDEHDSNLFLRKPLTDGQKIGWWRKDEPLKVNESWTQVKRHAHPQSEMTKFVDDMYLTDRYFRLF